MNPFDLTGPPFLGFYFGLFVVAVIVAIILRDRLRLPNDEPTRDMLKLDPYEIAYLAGGAELAVNAAIAGLAQSNLIQVSAAKRELSHTGQTPVKLRAMENYVYQAIGGGKPIKEVRDGVAKRCDEIGERLKQDELLCNDERASMARLIPTLLVLAVAAVGAIKIMIGMSRNKPVAFLVIATVVTVIVAFAGFARRPHRSHRGDNALDQLKEDNAALEVAASHRAESMGGEDFALAVGLFGMGVLAGSPLAELQLALRPPPGSSGSGCGSGSSCGGSSCGGGCGGGGCGGCGG